MAWQDYWRTQIDGVEEVDGHSGRTWLAALALLLFWESGLRRKLARRVASLPTNAAGFVDHLARDRVLRFRIAVRSDVERWVRGVSRQLAGRVVATASPVIASAVPGALGPDAVRHAIKLFDDAWARGRKIVERDEARQASASRGDPGVHRGGPGRSPGPDQQGQRGPAGSAAGAVPEQPSAKRREDADFLEAVEDQALNILRHVAYDGRRVTETIVRVTGRFNRPDDALDFLLGKGDRRRTRSPTEATDEGWRTNRNNMQLSVAAHLRGVHRRRTVSEATEAGVTGFRLDVPGRHLGKVDPTGILGPELWRVREMDDWLAIQSRANAGRISSSAWDTLGLGFGDVSYLIAVPLIYRAAAEAHGEKLRRRWLSGDGK